MKDTAVEQLIEREQLRQRRGLELIPSENYVSADVLCALGSVFTNKYSEGYPGRRYYGGQDNADPLELLAIERAKQLFGANHANVQPHSGAQANEAVYHAWLEPGDTVLAMDLSHGGHLTHGHPVTVLAKQYNFIRYKMKDISTGEIDYEGLRQLALEHRPKIILAGFSAYPRELDYDEFVAIGNEVGALLMADVAHIAGLIAAGVAKNPLTAGFHVMTTTTHKTLRGPRAGLILSRGTVGNPLKAPDKTIENIPTLIDRTVFPGLQGGPHMHVIAAKAVCFYEALQPEFQDYAKQIISNTKALGDELQRLGFHLVTGGSSNHLLLVDVQKSFAIDGAEAERALDTVGLTLNKNVIPDDSLPAFRPSGIRLGTPAVATRGMKEPEMKQIAQWMHLVITNKDNTALLADIKQQVAALCEQFPLPALS